MNERLQKRISFEEFELDTVHRKLRRDGKPVSLYAKTFDLLTFLVENRGRILTKDEILEAVWEGQFVEEANLSVQISALRKALNEDKDSPRFLLTVPGKGYKFIADIKDGNSDIIHKEHKKSFSAIAGEKKAEDKNASGQSDPNNDRAGPESGRHFVPEGDRTDQTKGEQPVPLSKGEQIRHYEIIEEVGRGGMGEVYLARDTKLNRQVALKLLAAHITEDRDRVNRFRQEGFATSALNHPNIITIYEIGKWRGRDFIVTEFVDGMTLRSLLAKKKMKINEVIDIALQTASALAATHEENIIHRDIKPENIMIRRDGLVKILDFGIARYRPAKAGQKALVETEIGEIIGTAAYMSPEQARGLKIDARTDIWSLGVILYEMIAGKLPFSGGTKSDRIAAILGQEPEPLRKNRRNIPPELHKVIDRSLSKNKEERYAEVSEMAEDLHHVQITSGEEHPKALRLPPKRSAKNYSYLFAGLAAVILATGTAAFFFTDFRIGLWQQKNTPIPQSQQQLISTFPGSHTQASFSPDGKRIAFVSKTDKIRQIWVKDLDGGEPVQITSEDKYAAHPSWSVNNEIAYVRGGKAGPEICIIAPEGSQPHKIIDGGRNPNWSWDGKKIVFERGYDVWTANKDGSEQRRVEGIPQTDILWADRMPAFSPDGSLIVFFQNNKGPMGDYWIIPSNGGSGRQLTNDRAFGESPAWTPDGESIIFPSQRGGSMTLWKVSTNGGEPEPVLSSAGEDTEPHFSRNGSKLIYTNTRKTYTLMLTDTESGEARGLKQSRFHLVYPSFSSDGSRIVFFGVNSEGDVHIFTIGTDGKNLTQVTQGKDQENIHPQWSEDGQSIYYYQAYPNASFRKIPVTGGEITELVKGWEWSTHNHAQVSPDGKRIIYTKLDRGTPVATMIRDIATGKETAFALPLRQLRWSHDGNFITGTDFSRGGWDLAEITVCTVEGKQCRKIAKGFRPEWSNDDSKIYYQTFSEFEGKTIRIVSRDGGDEKKVADLHPMESIGPFYAVSPQGEIVWVKYEQSKNELWLVDFQTD